MPVPLSFLALLTIGSCTATPEPVAPNECTDNSCPMRTVQIQTADEADEEKIVYVVVGAAQSVVDEAGAGSGGSAGSGEVEWIERDELLP